MTSGKYFWVVALLCAACGGTENSGAGGDGGSGGGGGTGGAAGAGGSLPLTCDLAPDVAPLCTGATCPFSSHLRVSCETEVMPRASLTISDATKQPLVAIQNQDGAYPLYSLDDQALKLVAEPKSPVAPTHDAAGALHGFDANGLEISHHTYPGGTTPLGKVDGEFLSSRLAVARGAGLAGLFTASTGWRLVVRDSAGAFAIENVGLLENPSLGMSDDGQPLLGFFEAQGGWKAKIRVAGKVDALPFQIGGLLMTTLGVVPGPDSWAAALISLDDGVHVALPSGSSYLVPDSKAFVDTSTCSQFNFTCPVSCDDSGQGDFAATGISLGAELLIVRITTVIKRSYTLESKNCFEHGCTCEKTLTDDSSKSELVLTRLDPTTGSFTELGRYPTTAVTHATLFAANDGDSAALMWTSSAGVEAAALSLATVANLP